ncbi:reverse transcriptase [Trichonephila clavipes]|nr:reverse transcriptase [Trichonephila clavipes]
MHLLSAGLAPAKVVFFIDSQAAILALSSNTPTDCLNTIQCRTNIEELIHMAGLRPYSGSQVILGSPAMKKLTKKPSREWMGPIPRQLERAEAVAHFPLTTGHDFLGVYLNWLGKAANEACPLCGHVRINDNHLPQCTGLAEYTADGIVSRYWEARCQMVKKPSMGVG